MAGVVAAQRSCDLLGSGSTPLAAQDGGLQLALLLAAAVALAASLVAACGLRLPKSDAPAAEATVTRQVAA